MYLNQALLSRKMILTKEQLCYDLQENNIALRLLLMCLNIQLTLLFVLT